VWDEFILFVAVGFAAQLVDGAIGMAYGLSATTVLLSLGFPPATASASVHAAEVFTTGISGLSHWRFGNVNWSFVWRLAVPGMLGGAAGAYLLTTLSGEAIAPFISAYLLLMGSWILWKALRSKRIVETGPPRWIAPLGLGGGFLDAIGGGGWDQWSPRPC
jgi:uncharacterized membrane protein YfcA